MKNLADNTEKMKKHEHKIIEKIEHYLDNKQLLKAKAWFEKLSINEQLEWLKKYKSIFYTGSNITKRDLDIVKNYFDLKDSIARLSFYGDDQKLNDMNSAFSKLKSLFPTPDKWSNYLSAKDILPVNDYRAEGYESAEEYFKNNKHLPPGPDESILNKAARELPFFDQNHNDQYDEDQYVRQADALIELYRYKEDIIDMFSNQTGSYGYHQENSEWVVKTFELEEPKHSSQNRTVEKLQGLYKDEFNRPISKTTILRLVGRAE